MRTHPEVSEEVELVARAMMKVCARPPGCEREFPVLELDPDFDELPLDHSEGNRDEDWLTQEGVLRLAQADIDAMSQK